jgi:hypothetical protein
MDLTKPPEKILVFSVAGVVLLLWVLVWLFGPKPEKVQPDVQPPISLIALQKKPVPKEKERVEDQIPRTWGRDPFTSPYMAAAEESKPVETGQPKTQRPEERPSYKVSTILISGSSRLAVIDDRVYGVGDQINGEKIARIALDHVVLTGDAGERLLRVPQARTEITAQEPGRK